VTSILILAEKQDNRWSVKLIFRVIHNESSTPRLNPKQPVIAYYRVRNR
jgi:hypothetical protein